MISGISVHGFLGVAREFSRCNYMVDLLNSQVLSMFALLKAVASIGHVVS